ncbi:MAG TPA: hypothetical protein VHG91_21125 [Longimicrobium sp.]|nr:hypothetical protein [Longimicrobium sp.]
MSGAQSGGEGRGKGPAHEETSRWEWVAAAVSGVVVFGAIGFLLFQALAHPATPPAITLAVDSVVAAPNGWLVELRVRNDGWTTAAGLQVEGELREGERSVEKSQTTIDYVPARAARRAGLFFTRDPRRHRLELRPLGYDRP